MSLSNDEIATMIADRTKGFSDQIMNSSLLVKFLKSNGAYRNYEGGSCSEESVLINPAGNFVWRKSYTEPIVASGDNGLLIARYQWGQIDSFSKLTDIEKDMNSESKERMLNLLDEKIEQMKIDVSTALNNQCYNGNPDANGGFYGLQALIADDPTVGVVGGIDRAQVPDGEIKQLSLMVNLRQTNCILQCEI